MNGEGKEEITLQEIRWAKASKSLAHVNIKVEMLKPRSNKALEKL